MIKSGVPNGYLYNWYAATAGAGTYETSSGSVSSSICPKGWTLPTISNESGSIINSTNEFGRLNQIYNNGDTSGTGSGTKLMESPLWFVRSGSIGNSSLSNAAANGRYWSSTVVSSDNAYFLYFNSSGVWPSSSYYRYFGWSVGCIAR